MLKSKTGPGSDLLSGGEGLDESGISPEVCNRHPGDCLSKYKTLFSGLSDLAYVCDADGKIIYINKASVKFTGFGPAELKGREFCSLLEDVTVSEAEAAFRGALEGGCPRAEFLFKKTGVLCESRNMPLMDGDGAITGVVGIGRDINDLKRYWEGLEEIVKRRTAELEEANERLKEEIATRKKAEQDLLKLTKAIEQSANLVCITDVNGVIEYVNPTFEKTTGWKKEEALGQNPRVIASGMTPKETYDELWATILSGNVWKGTFRNKRKDGGPFWVSAVISPIFGEEGRITHFLAVHEDITEQKVSREQIQFLSHYDGLTGLINRSRFIELLTSWIGTSRDRSARGQFPETSPLPY